ncbi:elongation factor G [bacterium]|nr:elongation factor G [bacterium]
MVRRNPIDKVRNMGIMAHIDAGKTTTTERILYYTGITYKMGEVDEGTAVMDWMAQEQERGITITSAATSCFWKNCQINIIDTPGHVDFTAEVERSLRVLDGAVIVLCGVGGLEAQSETVWRQADGYQIPRIVYINKMDRVGVNPEKAIQEMKDQLDTNPLVIQIPLGREENFRGVIDLVRMKEIDWGDNLLGTKFEVREISEENKEEAYKKRNEMLEQLSYADDRLMEKYLEEAEISPQEIKRVIRKGTVSLKFVPVLLGASFKNKGVHPLMDAIVDYLPSPVEVPPVKGYHPESMEEETRRASDDEPFSGLVFKIMSDPYVGSLAFLRVYSGKVKEGSTIYNSSQGKEGRISRLLEMHSNKRKEIKEAYAGDIAAIASMKEISTGDTLCTRNHPLVFGSIKFPEPVVSAIIEPRSRREHPRLSEALSKVSREDPSFKVAQDPSTGQTVVYGMGELHLEIIMDRMEREYGVKANLGKPQVAYKETITNSIEEEGKYIRQSGGRGQYGHCRIRIEPLGRGQGFEFIDEIKKGVIPKEYIPYVEAGVKEAMESGTLAGFPVTDVRVRLIDGSYHPVDSSPIAFKIAGSIAFKNASSKANSTLLEPVMSLVAVAPNEYFGDIVGDITARRGRVEHVDLRGGSRYIKALVPLAEMFGYATTLRTLTQGRGVFTMEFYRNEALEAPIMEEVIARIEGRNTANR